MRRCILCHDEQLKGNIAAPEDLLVRSMPHYGGVLVIMAFGYGGVTVTVALQSRWRCRRRCGVASQTSRVETRSAYRTGPLEWAKSPLAGCPYRYRYV